MSSTWEPPDPSTHHVGDDLPPPPRRRWWRRSRAPEHPTYRGRHDTRIVVLLVIAITVLTFATSDDSADITIQDLQRLSGTP